MASGIDVEGPPSCVDRLQRGHRSRYRADVTLEAPDSQLRGNGAVAAVSERRLVTTFDPYRRRRSGRLVGGIATSRTLGPADDLVSLACARDEVKGHHCCVPRWSLAHDGTKHLEGDQPDTHLLGGRQMSQRRRRQQPPAGARLQVVLELPVGSEAVGQTRPAGGPSGPEHGADPHHRARRLGEQPWSVDLQSPLVQMIEALL